ncbi:MAG: glycosyltransferase family 2 protein [Bacteroidetes bacterium]|nr:glycosyltransferase family 2 protein [Bacteroidota bacterium]
MNNKNTPLISVVIPSYNSSEFIRETIESVLNQTYKNFEIIVVDDESSDNTVSILKDLSNKNKRINYYQISHNGRPSVPRNYGVEKSNGKFVAFLDADDIWVENKLKKQISEFEKHPDYILVYSMSVTFGEANLFSPYYEVLPLLHKVCKRKQELLNMGNSITCSTVLINKEHFQKVGGFDEDPNLQIEDYDLWIRLSELGHFGFVSRIHTYYRVHGKQFSADWQTKQDRVKYLSNKRGWNLPEYKYYRNKGVLFLLFRNIVHYSNFLFVKFLSLFD